MPIRNAPRMAIGLVAFLGASEIAAQPEMVPADPMRAHHAYGYSVLPPPGKKWFVSPKMAGHRTAFYRKPSRREMKRMHSLVVAVAPIWVTGCHDADACLQMALAEMRQVESGSRHTMIAVNQLPAPGLQSGCTRITALQQDRGVPGQKGTVFEIHVDGMLCSHPDAPNLILHPNYSERLRQGDRKHRLSQDDVEEFLRGFEFKPVGPVVDSVQRFKAALGAIAWDGSHLWVQNKQQLSLVDIETNLVQRSFAVPASGMALEYAQQSLWLGETENRKLTRLDPETGVVVASFSLQGSPVDIASVGDSIWVTQQDHGDVIRIDAKENAIAASISVGTANTGVVAAFESIWVSNLDENSVFRINPATNSVIAKMYVCERPFDLVSLSDFVWVGCHGTGTIAKIDPSSNRVVARLEVGGSPFSLDGNERDLWITNQEQGTLSRFDIDAGEVSAILPIGPQAVFVLTVPGSVWVTEYSSGSLFRIVDRKQNQEFSIDSGSNNQ